jgi:hypothetical protein
VLRSCSRFPCLTLIAGQIIYYLTRVPGGQITRYFGYHSCLARMARTDRSYRVARTAAVRARSGRARPGRTAALPLDESAARFNSA